MPHILLCVLQYFGTLLEPRTMQNWITEFHTSEEKFPNSFASKYTNDQMKFAKRSSQASFTTSSILHHDYCGWNYCGSITSGQALFPILILKYPYSLPTFNYECVWLNYKDPYIKKLCLWMSPLFWTYEVVFAVPFCWDSPSLCIHLQQREAHCSFLIILSLEWLQYDTVHVSCVILYWWERNSCCC